MAITTIRDLAFKISMNVQIENLKKADKMVDDFKGKVTSMQRSVSKDIQTINRNFDNIRTFKAVKRINDITKATKDLNTAVKGATGVGTGATGGTTEPKQPKIPQLDFLKGGGFLDTAIMGLNKILALTISIRGVMRMWRTVVNTFNKSLEVYRDNMDGLIRQEAFYANALKYRERIAGENLKTGARTFQEYQKVAQKSIMETRKNIESVADAGVVSFKELNVMTGQLASFQIDTDAWFGGNKGRQHIESLADLMSSIQNTTGSRSEALRVANMIGKAVTMGQFGQLQRWGIVLSDSQKQIIKTGTTAERLSAIMEGLEQNVGNFNKEMAKTPYGKLLKIQNQISKQYFDLGSSMIYVKIQLARLWKEFLPFLSVVMKLGGAILGALAKALADVLEMINWLFTPTEELTSSMRILRNSILAIGTIALIAFAPMFALVLGLMLLFEDFWMFINGGESVIGDLLDWVDSIFKDIGDNVDSTIDNIGSFFSGIVKNVSEFSDEMRGKIKTLMSDAHVMIVNAFKDIGDGIKEMFNNVVNWFGEKIDSMVKKISDIKSKIPFIGGSDNNTNINADDITRPTADINNPTDRPNNSTNKSVNLELKIENGAIQQDFSGREYLTLEDIQSATTKSLEELFNSGLGGLMIEGGILQ